MKNVNEGFMSDMAYKIFKSSIFRKLKKIGIDPEEYANKIEEWCKDFYEDGFDATETFSAIRDSLNREYVTEDFSMGVGAPCGLDQGIPHGGDCKGCNPCRVAMVGHPVKHPPKSASLALTPGYWLNQIPKKKKKKVKKLKKHNLRKEAYEYMRPLKEDYGSDYQDFIEEVIEAMGMSRRIASILVKKNEDDVIAAFENNVDADTVAYNILKMYESSIRMAKKRMLENGYNYYYLGEPTLNEGIEDIAKKLKKIPELLKNWKKKADLAKKNKDKEELKEIQNDAEDLKDEIYDTGLLNKFRSKGLQKAVFAGIAALMLSAGATSALAAPANTNFSHNGSHASFESVMDNMDQQINAACKGATSCHVMEYGKSHSDSDNNHEKTVDSGTGDGQNTWSWELMRDKSTNDGGHIYQMSIDIDSNGKTDGVVTLATDADGNLEKGQVNWLDDHSKVTFKDPNGLKKVMPNLMDMIKTHM